MGYGPRSRAACTSQASNAEYFGKTEPPEGQILRSIEIPLGLPLILAGIRTAAVNVVATATLGAVVAGGALGRFIVDGFALREFDQLVAGGILVALLAIVTEAIFSVLERRSRSPGMAAIR